MLTQKDLDEIEEIVAEKIKILPTKEEFFSKMDQVMKELETIRGEQTIISHQVSDHEDRLEVLEEIQVLSFIFKSSPHFRHLPLEVTAKTLVE